MDGVKGNRRDLSDFHSLPEPGDYGKGADGEWYACPPGEHLLLGNLAAHEVVEHKDGTLTVSPSILVRSSQHGQWHGYLERGTWREV